MDDQPRLGRMTADRPTPERLARRASLGLVVGVVLVIALGPIGIQAADSTTPAGRASSHTRLRDPHRAAAKSPGAGKHHRPSPTPTPRSTTIPASTPTMTAPPTPSPSPSPTASQPPLPTPAAPAAGPSRFVSTTGSDGADGSANAPWRTIQHGVDVAPTGTTIVVGAGTYPGFSVTRPGLTVEAAPDQQVVVAGGTYVVLVRGTSDVTIRGLVVSDAPDLWGSGVRVETSVRVRIESNLIHDNHSFGIKVKDATSVIIDDNEITKNDTGIELSGAVAGAVVSANRIHHNDRMVTSSRGGNGIVFTMTTGAITVVGNRIWGNRAPHLSDNGYDGGAFEVYGASDLRIEDNVVWDNNNVMETGTDGTAPCARLTFIRNVAYGAGTVAGETTGLILRCASDSLFAHNTLDGLDDYAFYVASGGAYAGSIAGLRIEDNIVYRGRAYSLTSGLPGSLVIDHQLVRPGGSSATYATHVAYVAGHGNTDSLAEFTSWTGLDIHGIQADPRFRDADGRDYRLTSTSPAIDVGVDVTGDAYVGAAPDLGRFEYAP